MTTVHAATPVPGLTAAVVDVLRAAATVVADVSGEPIDVDALLATRGGVDELLRLLAASADLRAAVAAGTPAATGDGTATEGVARAGAAEDAVAAALVSADPADAERACDTVRRDVDRARKQARRDQRRDRRHERRGTVAARATARADFRVTELREQRDRATARLAAADADNAALRDKVADLADETRTLAVRLAAATRALTGSRRAAADPRGAAGVLSGLLTRRAAPSRDPRGTGPGEAGPVEARDSTDATVTPEELAAAATEAGLPGDVAVSAAVWLPRLLAAVASPTPTVRVVERAVAVDVLDGIDVGGSCVLVTAGDTRILVDAGARPGPLTAGPRGMSRALDVPLDAVVLTHAHNDHAGWTPWLLARRPDLPVLTSAGTAALLPVMWADSAKVLAAQHAPDDPPYGRGDVARALDAVDVTAFAEVRPVGSVTVELFPAGHIAGACGVVITAGDRRVVVSGDVSRTPQSSVSGIVVPESAQRADLLVLESTYAGVARFTPRAAAVDDFVRQVAATVSGGGVVLVPAFALGRAQEVALIIAERLPDVDVLVDGMARDVSTVYEQLPGPGGAPIRLFTGRVRQVGRGRTAAEAARFGPGVVIATSGMLSAGPSVTWARRVLPDPASAVMVVGYQDEESPGRQLLDLAEVGGGMFDLADVSGSVERVPVAAHVGAYHLGAHASADDLVSIAAEVAADAVMLVHGAAGGRRTFARRLLTRGQATVAADRLWTA